MTTQPTGAAELPQALRPIQRYKIGYHSDEWGVRSLSPSGIYDDAGPWVRYEDHAAVITALRAYCQELEAQVILDCMTHGQQSAEIEHVVGDVSKNGAESNMAQQPAPSAAHVVADALADSQYLAGVSAGWNAANADDPNSALQKLHESRAGYLKPLSAARAPAESVPVVEREQERIAFKDAHRHLELDEVPDAWGRPMFKHSHIEASWLGWIARASHGQAPAGAPEPTERQILEAAFAPAQPAAQPSRFGSPELQAMIIARCVEKDRAGSVLEDAARYRFLRDGEWRDTDLEPFIRLQLNTLWDAKIDAARAAQEGGK